MAVHFAAFYTSDPFIHSGHEVVTGDAKPPSSRPGNESPHSAARGETPPPNRETRAAGRGKKSPNKISRNFGRYRIIRRLGKGGMGTVFLAEDTQLQRQVALKIPQFDAENSEELLERFYREARAAATLNHPNLCPVHDVGEIDGLHYLTMAYIEGKPLSELIHPGEPHDATGTATIIHKLALALGEAHEKGIVHRDLKPDNISMNQRGEPVVMDFGLARISQQSEARLTKSGTVLGTPAYMAPEQIKGDVNAMGPGCDIYSLGVIFYELMTGQIPFDGPIAAVLGQVLTQDPAPPSTIHRAIDLRLEAICLKMMAKEPEDRYASMFDVADALGELLFEATRQGSFLSPSGPHKIAANATSTYKVAGGDIPTRRDRKASSSDPGQPGGVRQSLVELQKRVAPHKAVLGAAIGFVVLCLLAFQFLGSDDDGQQPKPEETIVTGAQDEDGKPVDKAEPVDNVKPVDSVKRPKDSAARTEVTNSIGMRLVLIPAGNFTMGESGSFDDEEPRHRVALEQSFYMGVYEVTQREYVAIMGTNPSFFRSDRRPVDSVSWKDAQEFCRKLSVQENVLYRLPTEAEWEYACRAETTTSWHFGDDESSLRDYGWSNSISGGSSSEVGRLKPNQFGLYDIHGNVSEWCEDWYSFNYYSQSPTTNPKGPQADDAAKLGYTKVVRGGSWDSTAANCRAAYRGTSSMMVRSSRTGFRVVRAVEK